jgi:D-arabinose 5-phosphate isomerase GutQ
LNREEALNVARGSMSQQVQAVDAVAAGLGDAFWTCAQLLSECQGQIWVTEVGTSAAVGARFANILTDCGARSMFLPRRMACTDTRRS